MLCPEVDKASEPLIEMRWCYERLFVSAGCEGWYGPASLGRVGIEEGGGGGPGGQEQVTVVIVVGRAAHRQRLDQWQSLQQSCIDYLSHSGAGRDFPVVAGRQ